MLQPVALKVESRKFSNKYNFKNIYKQNSE